MRARTTSRKYPEHSGLASVGAPLAFSRGEDVAMRFDKGSDSAIGLRRAAKAGFLYSSAEMADGWAKVLFGDDGEVEVGGGVSELAGGVISSSSNVAAASDNAKDLGNPSPTAAAARLGFWVSESSGRSTASEAISGGSSERRWPTICSRVARSCLHDT